MADSTIEKIKKWIKGVMGGMGGAVVSEKDNVLNVFNKNLTIVDFPAPEGAQTIITFP